MSFRVAARVVAALKLPLFEKRLCGFIEQVGANSKSLSQKRSFQSGYHDGSRVELQPAGGRVG